MRDNAKGGALTEVTFFILLSLYTPKHGYAVMQFIEDSTKGRLTLRILFLLTRQYRGLYQVKQLAQKGYGRKEIAEKELIRLNELVGVANGIIGGAV